MRILLVHPAPFEELRVGLENTVWRSEPVALTSIASMVLPDHEVEILDLRCEPTDALPRKLADWKPDVVGTTAMTTDAYQALSVLYSVRQVLPDALTVLGGHHPTLTPEFFQEAYVDVIVRGEGELVFEEICKRWSESGDRDRACMEGIQGTLIQLGDRWVDHGKSPWIPDLDTLPAPARHLIDKYKGEYFYIMARPLASIYTSRGCSFDCNFCAIWEFYERKTRYLSASVIADRMEACEEDFVFLLDDNFLSRTDRLIALADELERRGIKKYWMSQGRVDFVAKHPELIKRLAGVGLRGLLSGYESNSQDALDYLRKRCRVDSNKKAADILRENGIISTALFMVRPDFDVADFQGLYDYIEEMGVAMPLVSIQTPLPGTELWRQNRDKLLTEDFRLYDLSHALVPTRLPRDEFYRQYVRFEEVLDRSVRRWFTPWRIAKDFDFYRRMFTRLPSFLRRRVAFRAVVFNADSYMRDEVGIIPADVIATEAAAK